MHTTLNVTGRPAQFGRGVMADVSSRIIDKFAANLALQLAAPGEPEAAALPNGRVSDSRMAIPIQELNLPARSFKSLKGEGIDTVGELVSRTEGELLSIRNLGEKSVGENPAAAGRPRPRARRPRRRAAGAGHGRIERQCRGRRGRPPGSR